MKQSLTPSEGFVHVCTHAHILYEYTSAFRFEKNDSILESNL